MADTFGSTELNLFSCRRAGGAAPIGEKGIIKPPDSTDINSILQGPSGRQRKRWHVRGRVTKSVLDSLRTDMNNCTQRTLTLTESDGGATCTAIIERLEGERIFPGIKDKYEFVIDFAEVG